MNSKNIFNGLKWASIQLAFDSIIKFALKLLLAKLLLPEAFGLVGMCMVFIGITQSLSMLGLGAALVQKKEDKDAEVLYNTAFWTNLVFSVILYLLLSLIFAPIIATFYDEPLLRIIIPVLSLSIIFQPFLLIPGVILTRSLNFKKLSKSYNIASLFSGIISVTMAYFDYGVWALVFNYFLTAVIAIPFLYFSTKWKPIFEWKLEYFKDFFSFGMYATGSSLLRTLAGNIDYLIIGKLLGPNLLGAYTLAFTLTNQLRQFLSGVLNNVMYPVFGKYQDDPKKLKSFYLTILRVNAILIYPIMAFLIYFAEEIILLFGDEWTSAIVPLQILSAGVLVYLLVNTFDTLIRGRGKPKLELKIIALVNLLVLVPGLYLGTTYFGLIGASVAILLNSTALVSVALVVLKKEIGLNLVEPFIAIKSPFIGITLAMLFTKIYSYLFDIDYFIFNIFPFVLVYLGIIYVLEYKNFKEIFKQYLQSN